MSNSTATAWYYGTDVTLNKAGIWNINTTAIDSSGAINSTASNITVSIESQSTKDGWYGYANESYLTSLEIITLAGYGYDIFEFEENMTEQQASFSDLKTSINNSRESNIKSGINIILDFDYNSSALKLQYLTDITEDFGDLISIPYSDSVAYISFELENMGGYTNATLDALINEFAQNMTSITDNDFVIYSKNYNTTGLDSSYIQPTLMIYLNPADEETFINDQLSTFKQSTSLNRMYTQIPTAIKVLASEFQSSIIDNLRSVPDPGTLTQSNATSLANEDVIIFNNNSATTNYTINVSELSVTGKDVWDSTSGWLIEMNTTDVFTVSVPGYSAATILL